MHGPSKDEALGQDNHKFTTRHTKHFFRTRRMVNGEIPRPGTRPSFSASAEETWKTTRERTRDSSRRSRGSTTVVRVCHGTPKAVSEKCNPRISQRSSLINIEETIIGGIERGVDIEFRKSTLSRQRIGQVSCSTTPGKRRSDG